MKRELTYIEWEDHVAYQNSWNNFKDVDNKAVIIQSVGWVIAEDKRCISLAGCIDTQDFQAGKSISTILKSCIVKRRRLKF